MRTTKFLNKPEVLKKKLRSITPLWSNILYRLKIVLLCNRTINIYIILITFSSFTYENKISEILQTVIVIFKWIRITEQEIDEWRVSTLILFFKVLSVIRTIIIFRYICYIFLSLHVFSQNSITYIGGRVSFCYSVCRIFRSGETRINTNTAISMISWIVPWENQPARNYRLVTGFWT